MHVTYVTVGNFCHCRRSLGSRQKPWFHLEAWDLPRSLGFTSHYLHHPQHPHYLCYPHYLCDLCHSQACSCLLIELPIRVRFMIRVVIRVWIIIMVRVAVNAVTMIVRVKVSARIRV